MDGVKTAIRADGSSFARSSAIVASRRRSGALVADSCATAIPTLTLRYVS